MTAIAPRVGQLIRLLSSDRDGEVVAAAHAIGRTLKAAGKDWHDLARVAERHIGDTDLVRHHDPDDDLDSGFPVNPPSNWRDLVRDCIDEAKWAGIRLDDRELRFLESLKRWQGKPTPKQWAWVRSISERLGP